MQAVRLLWVPEGMCRVRSQNCAMQKFVRVLWGIKQTVVIHAVLSWYEVKLLILS